ncbi:MAG: hypothetical protein ACLGIV_06225 [Actinomycetes bacterium]
MRETVQGLAAAASGVAEVAGIGLRQLRHSMTARATESSAVAGLGRLREMVRAEVQRSIAEMGGVSATEVAELRHRIAVLEGRLAADEAAAAAGARAAKKTTPRKRAATRTPAAKASAAKAPAVTPATVAERLQDGGE